MLLPCLFLQGTVADEIPDFSYSRPEGPRQAMPPLPKEPPELPKIRFGVFIPFNPIDNFILARLQKEKVRPAGLCDDWDYARRTSLDIVGLVPTASDLERYFEWKPKERRAKWVDFLLRQPQYADHWTIFWGDLLREQGRSFGGKPNALREYLHQSLRENRRFDEWVRRLITASGTTDENPAVGFVLRDRGDADVLTVSVTQSLMGVQLKCAQCHDHPFDWWTQHDFQGMAGFWKGTRPRPVGIEEMMVGQRKIERPIFEIQSNPRRADGTFLTGTTSQLGRGREALAELITRDDNPYFARVAVNRLWEKLFGTGLVSPSDNFTPLNPPSHPELLDWLAMEFVAKKYDLMHMLRLMATSRTYQQTSTKKAKRQSIVVTAADSNDAAEVGTACLFEAMPLRKMTSEQIHDSILAATGHYWRDDPHLEPSIRKMYPPPPQDFLRIFGTTDRDTLLPRPTSPTVQQALTLLNGDLINRAVMIHADHPLVYWQSRGFTNAQMVDALFVQLLTRLPTPNERRMALQYIGYTNRAWPWEDVQWALINTREFQYIR